MENRSKIDNYLSKMNCVKKHTKSKNKTKKNKKKQNKQKIKQTNKQKNKQKNHKGFWYDMHISNLKENHQQTTTQ